MKVDLAGVIRDVQLTTLAFAIALGWSLYQTALGVATFIEAATVSVHTHVFDSTYFVSLPQEGLGLTWVWGHHEFTFGQLVLGLIELGTVLLAAALVRRFARR